METYICPFCSSTDVTWNEEYNEYRCSSCGMIYSDEHIQKEELRHKMSALLMNTSESKPKPLNVIIMEDNDENSYEDKSILSSSTNEDENNSFKLVDDKIIIDEGFFLNLAGVEIVVALDDGPLAVENVDGPVRHDERFVVACRELRDIPYVVGLFLFRRIVRLVKYGIACGILVPHSVGVDMQKETVFAQCGRNFCNFPVLDFGDVTVFE